MAYTPTLADVKVVIRIWRPYFGSYPSNLALPIQSESCLVGITHGRPSVQTPVTEETSLQL